MEDSYNLVVLIEPKVKEEAKNILSTLGISASEAIDLVYKQIILQRGIPSEVLPIAKTLYLIMKTIMQEGMPLITSPAIPTETSPVSLHFIV